MSVTWKISTDNTAWQTFAEMGVVRCMRHQVGTGRSTVRLTLKGDAILTDDSPFTYDAGVWIKRNESQWFFGIVGTLPRYGEPQESCAVELVSPWIDLEHCPYRQQWRVYDTDSGSEIDDYKERVILFQNSSGDRTTSGAQMIDAIDWAISRGARLQRGSIEDGVELPFDERENISCADVIYTILRGQPDLLAWFNFSASGYPSLNITKRSNMSSVSFAVGSKPLSKISPITPRYDIQVPGVQITYEKLHSNNSRNFRTIERDVAGDVTKLRAVFLNYDLEGTKRTWQSQTIKCAAVPDPLTDKAWWKKHDPWLADIANADLTLSDGTFKDAETGADLTGDYSVYLVEGTLHDWLNEDYTDAIISCKATGVIRDDYDDDEVEKIDGRVLSVRVVATTAAEGEPDLTKTYWRLTDLQTGEATPTDVAARLYTAWNTLQYEGSIVLHEQECGSTLVRPGQKLTLTGGRSEWATMDAVIQEVTEDVGKGVTTIKFGPPARLQASDLIALFRHARNRRYSFSREARTDPETGGAESITSTGTGPVHDASDGHGRKARLVIKHSTDNDGRLIDLDPNKLTSDGHTMQPRELSICTATGEKRAMVLMTALYDPPE